ncbi:YetF domain-containing protein [Clostridium sporogenes]
MQEGKFIVKNFRKIRYSIDNILQMLREKDIFDINDVHIGIVEANGNIL